MNTMTTAVDTITPIQGEEARRIATTEYRRMTDLLRSLERDVWARHTPVRAGRFATSLATWSGRCSSTPPSARPPASRPGPAHRSAAWPQRHRRLDRRAGRGVVGHPHPGTDRAVHRAGAPAVAKRMAFPRLLARVKVDGGPDLTLDALEFCRILSGRGKGEGLLTQGVLF